MEMILRGHNFLLVVKYKKKHRENFKINKNKLIFDQTSKKLIINLKVSEPLG